MSREQRKSDPEHIRELIFAIEQVLNMDKNSEYVECPIPKHITEADIAAVVRYFNDNKNKYSLNYAEDNVRPSGEAIFAFHRIVIGTSKQ